MLSFSSLPGPHIRPVSDPIPFRPRAGQDLSHLLSCDLCRSADTTAPRAAFVTARQPRLRIVQTDATAEAGTARIADHAELERALELVRGTSEAREAKIQALKAAIAAGAYQPDPREIARRILEHGL